MRRLRDLGQYIRAGLGFAREEAEKAERLRRKAAQYGGGQHRGRAGHDREREIVFHARAH